MSALVVVVGPTGSGKSELALHLAEALDGEIVNCDSVQLFRFFDIGTAKMPLAERRGIRHHLMDVADPDETFTAGDYARVAAVVIGEIQSRQRLPILVGGTGFYLRALLNGLPEAPPRDDAVRERLTAREALRHGSLHRILRRLDPGSAARIHANDTPKLTRALELRLITGGPASALASSTPRLVSGRTVVKIGLDPARLALYQKLDVRCAAMFAAGLIEETASILNRGYSPKAKPFESLGYAQILRVLRQEISVEQAIAETQQQTRRYAKRQMTWFRREPDVHWIPGFGSEAAVQQEALRLAATVK